jgi:hypothetical protein
MTIKVHFFPKWLFLQRFEIHYYPELADREFTVRLFGRGSSVHHGIGNSVAEAAKNARKKRALEEEAK